MISLALSGQKKELNRAISLSSNLVTIYEPSQGATGGALFPQIQFTYLPQQNRIMSFAIGSYFDKSRFSLPLWASFNYLILANYSKKKKIHFLYGGRCDVGIGEFIYAEEQPRIVTTRGYYKRLLASLSPQGGFWFKTGKKSFITTTLSAGLGSTFFKISQAPSNSYYHRRLIVPIGFRIEYSYLFGKKR